MSERRPHKSWCPAYPGNVYVKTTRTRATKKRPLGRDKVEIRRDGECQCGADLSERARRLITGEAS